MNTPSVANLDVVLDNRVRPNTHVIADLVQLPNQDIVTCLKVLTDYIAGVEHCMGVAQRIRADVRCQVAGLSSPR